MSMENTEKHTIPVTELWDELDDIEAEENGTLLTRPPENGTSKLRANLDWLTFYEEHDLPTYGTPSVVSLLEDNLIATDGLARTADLQPSENLDEMWTDFWLGDATVSVEGPDVRHDKVMAAKQAELDAEGPWDGYDEFLKADALNPHDNPEYRQAHNLDLPYEDRAMKRKVSRQILKEFKKTPAWTVSGQISPELAEAQDFKVEVTKKLAEAFVGYNGIQDHTDRSKFIAEQLGLVNDETDPSVLKKAHQAYFLAFHFADKVFRDCRGVEGTFNQRGTLNHEWKPLAEHARLRVDSDPDLAKKLYTALPLFTETAYEQEVAMAVMSMALFEIAHWKQARTVVGEIKSLNTANLNRRFGSIATKIAKDKKWAAKVGYVQDEPTTAKSSKKSKKRSKK